MLSVVQCHGIPTTLKNTSTKMVVAVVHKPVSASGCLNTYLGCLSKADADRFAQMWIHFRDPI